NAVENATNYFVSVNGSAYVDNGAKTSFSLKEFAAEEGKLNVKVYPATKGYNSPAASEIACEKNTLATPKNVKLEGSTLSWDEVSGATSYEVKIGDKVLSAGAALNLDLSDKNSWKEGEAYALSVRALGASQSLWSDALVAKYLVMDEGLTYHNNTLSWKPVLGAASYAVQVNGGEFEDVGNVNSVKVALTQAGYNTLSVKFHNGTNYTKIVSIQVYAYTLTFDGQLATATSEQYKAVGDEIELAEPSKNNHDFAGWYNVPGGAASNGIKFSGKLEAANDIILYAYYTPKKYKVVFDYGADATGDLTETTVQYGSNNFKFPVPKTSNGELAFLGWYSGSTQLTDSKGDAVYTWRLTSDEVTVSARWADGAFTFTLTQLPRSNEDVYAVSKGDKIGNYQEITIPQTYNGLPVAMIDGEAFYGTNLQVINIPDTVQLILSPSSAFGYNNNLREINVFHVEGNNLVRYASIDGVLYDYGDLDESDLLNPVPKLSYVPRAVEGDLEIPEGTTTIYANTFYQCNKITSITFPASVTFVDTLALFELNKLEAITFRSPQPGQQTDGLVIANDAVRLYYNDVVTINFPSHLREVNFNNYSLKSAVGA
ncbi:MAG: leucine-rich repeat protein, partial [Clostridiales bacterium]|nr:leucine-rich repeat protein [Clostridiales bacterium]